MWFKKKNRAAVTGELPLEMSPIYAKVNNVGQVSSIDKAFWSHVGLVRQNNEDSYAYSEQTIFTYNSQKTIAVAVIADGMGGLELGEEVSSRVVNMFQQLVYTRIMPHLNDGNKREVLPWSDLLCNIVREINDQLYQHFRAMNGRSGSTLSAVVICDQQCHIVHVGDSRIYLIDTTQNRIEKITEDHSYVGRLVKLGQLTEEEARNHPRKNEIYKMIAFEQHVEPDYVSVNLAPQQSLLLCSDGLTDLLTDEEILEQTQLRNSPNEVVTILGQLANQRGGYDNCTIMYLTPIYN